jgi:hypothetical protein
MAFPLIPNSKSEAIFKKMKLQPRFDDAGSGFEFKPLQGDVNATSDKKLLEFDVEQARDRIPVIGGSSFNLWNPNFGLPYAYTDEKVIRDFLLEKTLGSARNSRSAYLGLESITSDNLPFDQPRIVFRDISNQTNTRTVICALIPPRTICTHKSPVLVRRKGTEADEAFLLGIMSSLIYDWYMRRWVELHVTFELLNPSPIPQPKSDLLRKRLIVISATLASVDTRYSLWAKAVGIDPRFDLSESEKFNLICELDAIVAIMYGLNRVELQHLFASFHRGWDYTDRMRATVEHFESLGGEK